MAEREVKAWAGFVDGKLHLSQFLDPDYTEDAPRIYSVFSNRKVAQRGYEDVRRITITYDDGKEGEKADG